MKKIAMLVLAMASTLGATQVFATASPIGPSGTPAAFTVTNADCAFVNAALGVTGFQIIASREVGLAFACSPTVVSVNAGNRKGKYTYGGSSNGGSVTQCGTTPADTTTGWTIAAPNATGTGTGCN